MTNTDIPTWACGTCGAMIGEPCSCDFTNDRYDAPEVEYLIGLPVVVTVYPSGAVRFTTDLSDATDTRDVDLTPEQVAAIDTAVGALNGTVTALGS